MGRSQNQPAVSESRLKRLAASIEALAAKDDEALHRARDIAGLRRLAAGKLYGICTDFVTAVNGLLTQGEILLDPPDYVFREEGTNLLQINARGRILQIEFETTPELVSTEDFRVPYTLSGSIRAFNKELLEKSLIEEQLIFYTLEKDRNMWRFFDARTYRSGPLDQEYLVALMEQLV
jgi:hypothetical protein